MDSAVQGDVVAIISADKQRTAIWHVVLSPDYPMGRLCGAWIDVIAPALIAGRLLLPWDGHLPGQLVELSALAAGVFDPHAVLDTVAGEIAALDALHRASPRKDGKPREPVNWPRLPAPLVWSNPPQPPRGVAGDPLTSRTIGLANWVARLADAWAAVEVIRLSREYLAAGGTKTPRPMPTGIGVGA